MWEDDWAQLGIAPTPQLAAIKKAYAARLKVTRPDDDAEAYQALRAAYERTQQWAAWARVEIEQGRDPMPRGAGADEAPAPDDALTPAAAEPVALPATPAAEPLPSPAGEAPTATEVPAAAPEAATVAAPPPAPAEPELPLPPRVEPAALIEALEQAWRRHGAETLMARWQDTRRVLDEQPLARQAEFSAAFAKWLLHQGRLPDALATALDAHFEWSSDFRTERLIGAPLTHAVQAALAERRPVPVDPALRAVAEPLLRVSALRGAGRWALLQCVLLMLQPTLARLLGGLPAEQLRLLGLGGDERQWLAAQVKHGMWLRVGACSLLVMAVAGLNAGDGVVAVAQTIMWAACMALLLAIGVFLGSFINKGPSLSVGQRHWALPLDAWRQRPMQPMLGVVWLLFAAWLVYLTVAPGTDLRAVPVLALLPDWAWGLGAFGFGVAGLLVAWPRDPLHGLVIAGIVPLVTQFFEAALGAWLPQASSLCLATAWALASAALYSDRVSWPGWLHWFARPVLNSLTVAERWTFGTAMLPVAAALAWQLIREGSARPLTLFMIWALGLLVVAQLQQKLDELALRRLLPAPASA